MFRIDQDSFGARLGNGRWFPMLNLIWLFWMVGSPWFTGRTSPWVIAITLLSVPLFLILYFRAWYGPRRQIVAYTLCIAVLGLAIIPINTSWSYIIYAAVLVPYCTTPRRALVWLAALLGAFFLVAMQNGFSMGLAFAAVSMCTGIALMNLFGKINRERDSELRLSHDEVRRLAATAERERIGRDLHDLLGHSLSLIAIKSELADKLFERDPLAARNELREVNRVARDSLAQVRSAVTGIRAAGIAAEAASAKLLLESSGIQLESEIADIGVAMPVEHALALCLREAATNIHRHARASRAMVSITRHADEVQLKVSDNGIGGAIRDGNGLSGMRERVAVVHGSLQLESPRGRGTTVTIRMRAPQSAGAGTLAGAALPPTKLDGLAVQA